jgi:hypothetical protein
VPTAVARLRPVDPTPDDPTRVVDEAEGDGEHHEDAAGQWREAEEDGHAPDRRMPQDLGPRGSRVGIAQR